MEVKLSSESKLALMGGAYGNLPALEACIEDARNQGCSALAFLGDSIGFCGHSDETIDLIRDNFDLLVAGNHEHQAAIGAETCGCGYSSPEDERLGCVAFETALESLSEANRAWLGTWPETVVVELGESRILLCHGSPSQTNEFLYESELDKVRVTSWLDENGVEGFVCTHTGISWVHHTKDNRFALNCSVVGKPESRGLPSVKYATLELKERKIQIEFRLVAYDHTSWTARLEEEGIEEVFIEPLRTGLWTCGVESLPEWERERVEQMANIKKILG